MPTEPDLVRTEGDTEEPLTITFKSRISETETEADNLTGKTLRVYGRAAGSGTNLPEFNGKDLSASVPTPTNGQLVHTLTAAEAAELTSGRYWLKFKATIGTSVKWYPNDRVSGKTEIVMDVEGNFE
jgi:hypothetical protein